MHVYAIAFGAAFSLALGLTPVARWLAQRFQCVDEPNERRLNQLAVPNTGGLAIAASVFLTLGGIMLLAGGTGPLEPGSGKRLLAIGVGAIIILITGLADDRWELPPGVKLGGQVVAALAVSLLGVQIQFVTNPFGGMLYLGLASIPVTVLWIVALTNALNFIDGLDGLAAGVVVISSVPLFLLAQQTRVPLAAMLIAVCAGSTLGFLPYNFTPASIFMGDAGAMFLGYLIAAVSVIGALKGPTVVALGIPFIALGLPIFDTAFAVMRRRRRGVPIYQADSGHIHHRLLALGFSPRAAVGVLYTVAAMLAVNAVLLVREGELTTLLGVLALLFMEVLMLHVLLAASGRGHGGTGMWSG